MIWRPGGASAREGPNSRLSRGLIGLKVAVGLTRVGMVGACAFTCYPPTSSFSQPALVPDRAICRLDMEERAGRRRRSRGTQHSSAHPKDHPRLDFIKSSSRPGSDMRHGRRLFVFLALLTRLICSHHTACALVCHQGWRFPSSSGRPPTASSLAANPEGVPAAGVDSGEITHVRRLLHLHIPTYPI